VHPRFSCNRYLNPISKVLHYFCVAKPIKMIPFNISCTECRQSTVLGCKLELPSYPAYVVGLKICEEVVTVHSGFEARSGLPQLWWVLWTHVTCGVYRTFYCLGQSPVLLLLSGCWKGSRYYWRPFGAIHEGEGWPEIIRFMREKLESCCWCTRSLVLRKYLWRAGESVRVLVKGWLNCVWALASSFYKCVSFKGPN
jgi:hypothetical protein